MSLLLETERLFLRPFEAKDAAALFDLNNDKEVMLYTGDVPFESLDAATEFAEKYAQDPEGQFQRYKKGRLAVIRKEGEVFLGWSGLKLIDQKTDIGYRFLRQHWGKGYATEAGLRILEHAFVDHKEEEVIATVHELNLSSQKLAQRLGMQLSHRFLWEEREPAQYYQINKDDYRDQTCNR